MNKVKLVSVLAGAAMLLGAAPAMAASVSSNAVFDGQTQVYGNAGSSVQATFQVHVNSGEVLHAIRTKVDGQATVCTPLGPVEGAQDVNVDVNITLPPNTNNGGYSLVADLYTTDTVQQADAMSGNLACTSSVSGSHVFTAAYNGGTVVNVLPVSGSTNTGNTGSSNDTAIQAILAWIQSQMHPTTPAPTGNAAKCAAIAPYVNAPANTYSPMGVQLQSALLLDNPNSIPALAAGATIPMGYFGPQTHAALYSYNAVYGCH